MNNLQAHELNAYELMQAHELAEIVGPRERFKIETIDQVSWALRKLSAIKAKKEEIRALADAEIARIMDWAERENRSLDRDAEFFEGLLQEYMLNQRMRDPQFKKTSTPYGTVKFRKQPAKWEYNDEKLIESLKAIGRTDLIRVKEEPNKEELKKIAAVKDGQVIDPESGAVVEGVLVIEQGESVVVEVS